ncbi:MAG: hypothetical protein COB02_13750 [Candidatus Cloacimonadota bacterium]|nr:MAG: hypothetical protein COB02_13750 [Candidatus Cloacimonadota bacterium]
MITDIPIIEPSEVFQGDSIDFEINLQSIGVKSSDGWILTYSLRSVDTQYANVVASQNQDNFLISISSTITSTFKVGLLSFISKISKGTIVKTINSGTIDIKSSFNGLTSFDGRSHARKVLESIEAVIEKRATKDQESYSIKGRSLSRTPIEDLINLRKIYKAELRQEEHKLALKNGKASQSNVYVRFS